MGPVTMISWFIEWADSPFKEVKGSLCGVFPRIDASRCLNQRPIGESYGFYSHVNPWMLFHPYHLFPTLSYFIKKLLISSQSLSHASRHSHHACVIILPAFDIEEENSPFLPISYGPRPSGGHSNPPPILLLVSSRGGTKEGENFWLVLVILAFFPGTYLRGQ